MKKQSRAGTITMIFKTNLSPGDRRKLPLPDDLRRGVDRQLLQNWHRYTDGGPATHETTRAINLTRVLWGDVVP